MPLTKPVLDAQSKIHLFPIGNPAANEEDDAAGDEGGEDGHPATDKEDDPAG